jgi:hypothetical protein
MFGSNNENWVPRQAFPHGYQNQTISLEEYDKCSNIVHILKAYSFSNNISLMNPF